MAPSAPSPEDERAKGLAEFPVEDRVDDGVESGVAVPQPEDDCEHGIGYLIAKQR